MLSEKEIVKSNLGIVAYDSGGANYIKSFILHYSIYPNIYVGGPAESIFKSIKGLKKFYSIEEIVNNSEILIFGSGWETKFEMEALLYAKNKIPTITFLDHWTNYKQRFIINDKEILPDIIVVFDIYAYELAKKSFPGNKNILHFSNYYLINQLSESHKFKNQNKHILFIDEPIMSHYESTNNYKYDEFSGLKYFLNHIKENNLLNEKIKIRLHPSENNINKYRHITKSFDNITISKINPLVKDILHSKYVIGFESMALVVSVELNKKTYTIIPPGCGESSLPHRNIKSFYYEN